MTYEEALQSVLRQCSEECGKIDTCRGKDKECAEAAVIKALKKQIPKKPTMGKYGHTECACCGWVVESFCGDLEQYPFCPNCGHAIDWGVSK